MRVASLLVAILSLGPAELQSQSATTGARIRIAVTGDSQPVAEAIVRAGAAVSRTNPLGIAALRVAAGEHRVIVQRLGFTPESLTVVVRADSDTTIAVELETTAEGLETVIVTSTRSERRVQDEAARVDVLKLEEIEEKMMMTPGDIVMMLNETTGLRVQTTSPSMGGAGVRIQGLRSRHTQLLSDGLPLYGGQSGALGLLQIPPMDLGQVEVIKGAASALYGSSALGGVINLISRRPALERETEMMINQTSRGGSDALLWSSGPVGAGWSYTLLGGAHRQSQRDLDDDGWTDMPGYERFTARPRFFHSTESGRNTFLTAGLTSESRDGGTLPGRDAPDGAPFAEALTTRRADVGVLTSMLAGNAAYTLRASAMDQRHEHRFGSVVENDNHRTVFAELTGVRPIGALHVVAGASYQRDQYRSDEFAQFDYAYSVVSAFAQVDADPASWVSVSASARLDAHNEFGTVVNPRAAALVRGPREWTLRASVAGGAYAPTPFTEETEVTGLGAVDAYPKLRSERATSGSVDLGGPLGPFEVSITAFASSVRHPVATTEAPSARLTLVNAAEPTRTSGNELFVRWDREPFVLTASYTFVKSTEHDPEVAARRAVPLTPRHSAGIVGMVESEGKGRAGFEVYYTGSQSLHDNPYRTASDPYVIVGLLAERYFGRVRVFINAENLGNVRQSNYDPLLRPAPGRGGRWTTDAWTELSGRTINGGVRITI